MTDQTIGPPRCQERTLAGVPCRAFACHGDTRCRRHGGVPGRPRTCTCPAYRWPHRPQGGLCRWPDPPLATCPTEPGVNRPTKLRLRGYRKQIARDRGWHPIRDRQQIAQRLPAAYDHLTRAWRGP